MNIQVKSGVFGEILFRVMRVTNYNTFCYFVLREALWNELTFMAHGVRLDCLQKLLYKGMLTSFQTFLWATI